MGNAKPILGYGFKGFLSVDVALAHRDTEKYSGGHVPIQEAHSIYFQILGEQGYVGLAIFLALGTMYLLTTYGIYRRTRHRPELFWAHRLARALMLSGIAFAVSGTFLSQAYADYYYLLVALTICLARIVRHGDVPPKVDNFPYLLSLLRIDAAVYGLAEPKPAMPVGATAMARS
jgi:putative inorganic carbon (hco3(-)) transporter